MEITQIVINFWCEKNLFSCYFCNSSIYVEIITQSVKKFQYDQGLVGYVAWQQGSGMHNVTHFAQVT